MEKDFGFCYNWVYDKLAGETPAKSVFERNGTRTNTSNEKQLLTRPSGAAC